MSNNAFFQQRAKKYIPGGAHTYSKGDDQFPANAPAVIAKGNGCHIWDADNNQYLDFALSLGTVVLGHAYEPVLEAVRAELINGVNFVRPSPIEGELAERLCHILPCAEMVKLAKHGSDATTGAIKLARAYTGREYVVRCSADPFNAVHDWFIGSTVVNRGVPEAVRKLTLQFEYNNLASLEALFDQYPEQIACVLFEPVSFIEPAPGFLQAVKALCERQGAILIFDEVVSGFRFALGGAQQYCGVTPHLAAFGKAMANGFSVSALAGSKEIMSLGGIDHDQERVFLLSTTHGGETHSIAAALKTLEIIENEQVIDHFWHVGRYLKQKINQAAEAANFAAQVKTGGYDCKPSFAIVDNQGNVSMALRTLFLQETLKRGLMLPYIVPCYSHTDEVIDQAAEIMFDSFTLMKQALDTNSVEQLIVGDIVKPVFRKFN